MAPHLVASDDSPLKIFKEAKKQIETLYANLDTWVLKASAFYSDNELDEEISKNAEPKHKLALLNQSIKGIQKILESNQMKVAFFGRTSNGKSTTINAILHDAVLPAGYGHTTNRFLQIQGNRRKPKTDAYLIVTENNKPKEYPVKSVANLADALKNEVSENFKSSNPEHSMLVDIYWPVSKCPLLKYDVVLVDSPGVDVQEDLDKYIDEYCNDADVFVLVSNAESTLNIAEKNFFHKVSKMLSKPSLFVLYNKWDIIAQEPDCIDVVRKQHVSRAVQFLSNELKVVDEEQAKKQTFFVSAREVLKSRMSGPTPNKSNNNTSDCEERDQEFIAFENKFEECLSKSAVKTKFEKHIKTGCEKIENLTLILDETKSLIQNIKQSKEIDRRRDVYTKESIDASFRDKSNYIKQIENIKLEIQQRSTAVFEKEIYRLSSVIDDFEEYFEPHPHKLIDYRNQLFIHVSEALSENLDNHFEKVVISNVNPFIDQLDALSTKLSKTRQENVKRVLRGRDIYSYDKKYYQNKCHDVICDFVEDLEFRFTFSIFSLMRRFGFVSQSKQQIDTSDTCELDYSQSNNDGGNADILAVIERFIQMSPQSPTTVGTLAAGGILVRTVGWKIIAATSFVYGAIYFYEYLTWTNAAKKKAFKKQFVRHAKNRLRGAGWISDAVASSAQHTLQLCFQEVAREVDAEREDLGSSIGKLEKAITKLVSCEKYISELLGQKDVMFNEFAAFATTFNLG